MSTGYSWEGIRQVRTTLLGARHVPDRLCGGHVILAALYQVLDRFLPLTRLSLQIRLNLNEVEAVTFKVEHETRRLDEVLEVLAVMAAVFVGRCAAQRRRRRRHLLVVVRTQRSRRVAMAESFQLVVLDPGAAVYRRHDEVEPVQSAGVVLNAVQRPLTCRCRPISAALHCNHRPTRCHRVHYGESYIKYLTVHSGLIS